MIEYTFEVQIAENETPRVRVEDKISVSARTYEIALDKLYEAVQMRHQAVCEIFVDRFSVKIK